VTLDDITRATHGIRFVEMSFSCVFLLIPENSLSRTDVSLLLATWVMIQETLYVSYMEYSCLLQLFMIYPLFYNALNLCDHDHILAHRENLPSETCFRMLQDAV